MLHTNTSITGMVKSLTCIPSVKNMRHKEWAD